MVPGTPFGEMIFPMSRAFWDGDEEDLEEVPVDKRKVELNVTKPVAFSGAYDIVVVEGYLAADFVRAFMKEKDVKPVGNCSVEGPEETPHCKRCIVELFSPSDNLLVCVCTNFFQVDLANDVFFKLHDHFGYEWNFLGLVSRSIVDYVSPTGSCDETFLLRQLSSKLASNPGGVKRLEAPNFITGLVAAGDAPFLVSFIHRTSDVHYCSGAIIDPKFVLTTGACATSYKLELVMVVAGGTQVGIHEGTEQVTHARTVVLHTEFVPSDTTPTDDIALIEVWPHFKFNDVVGPARLPIPTMVVPGEMPLALFGLFTTMKVRKDRRLDRQAAMTVVFAMNSTNCYEELVDAETPSKFVPQLLCTNGGFLRGRNCQADRGSPLVKISSLDQKTTLVGLQSWMASCISAGFPDVHVKITYYLTWIFKQIEIVNEQSPPRSHKLRGTAVFFLAKQKVPGFH